MSRPAVAHVWSVVAGLAVVVVVSALWLAWYKSFPRGTGFDDLTGIYVPFGLLGLAVLWFAVRAVLHGRVRWRAVTVIVASLALALAPVVVTCGPVACFTPGSARLMGWFLVGGLVAVAIVHHAVLESVSRRAGVA